MSEDKEDEVDSGSDYGKHPALKKFNRMGFMVKHVLKGVLKWGAIGAIAGVAMAAAATLMAGIAGGILTPIVALAAYFIPALGEVGKDMALTTLGYAGGGGAIVGAAVGGIIAITGASEAADAEEDRLVAKYEQQEARKERMLALERRRDEQKFAMEKQSMAMRGGPGTQIPRGKPGHGALHGGGHAHA